MLNPNGAPRVVSDYEQVEGVLEILTPDPKDFAGKTYPVEDVRSDMQQLEVFKHTPEYNKSGERSDAKLLEKTFINMVEKGDWFGEDEMYGNDPDFLALVTFPTAEIDDTFNHIDMIGVVGNEATKNELVPFAIDLTYNTDNDKMGQKFRWRHVYGKKKAAPEEVSEFGESDVSRDYYDRNTVRSRSLPLRFRYGLKIPGFAAAKYFEDKNNPWNPVHEKGRIRVMPRFIVGYSTDIADALAGGLPDKEYRRKYGEQAYQYKRKEYADAEKRAKWCTLFECHEQASDIRYMLEHLSADEVRWMHPRELEEAKRQIIAMDTFFAKAINAAIKKAQTNADEMAAMRYADRDTVRQAIMRHSSDTYIGKNWK